MPESIIKTARPSAPVGAKYSRLVQELRQQIVSGELAPGAVLDSESQLCALHGMSRGPVRQALAELERERLIFRIPGKGTYVSDRQRPRRQPAVTRLHVLVDATAGLDDNFVAMEIIEGLNQGVAKLGFSVRLQYEFHRFGQNESLHQDSLYDGRDGVLVVPFTQFCVRSLERLMATDVPVIGLFDRLTSDAISNLYIDHERAAYGATQLLLRFGHRRIAFLRDSPGLSSAAMSERLAGFARAMRDAGLDVEPSAVGGAENDPVAVRNATRALLAGPDAPTALLVGGGLLIPACLQTVRALERRVPDDLSIIAFDDTADASLHEPPISVVKQPLRRLAERALEQMVAEIADPSLAGVRTAMVPELILRESCGQRP